MSRAIEVVKTYPSAFDAQPSTIAEAMDAIDRLTRLTFDDQASRGVKLSHSNTPHQFVSGKITVADQGNEAAIRLVSMMAEWREKVSTLLYILALEDERNVMFPLVTPEALRGGRNIRRIVQDLTTDASTLEDVPLRDVSEKFWLWVGRIAPELAAEVREGEDIGAAQLFGMTVRYVIPLDPEQIPHTKQRPRVEPETSWDVEVPPEVLARGNDLMEQDCETVEVAPYIPGEDELDPPSPTEEFVVGPEAGRDESDEEVSGIKALLARLVRRSANEPNDKVTRAMPVANE